MKWEPYAALRLWEGTNATPYRCLADVIIIHHVSDLIVMYPVSSPVAENSPVALPPVPAPCPARIPPPMEPRLLRAGLPATAAGRPCATSTASTASAPDGL